MIRLHFFLKPVLALSLLFSHYDAVANAQQDTTKECPAYRVFDTESPSSTQYLAPDGCRCVDGMSDLHCAFCSDDAPCAAEHEGHVCRRDLIWAENDVYKSYKCKLFGTLDNLFSNGKVSVHVNRTDNSARMSIFNTNSINEYHAVDCIVTGCDIKDGATDARCELARCNCTDQCHEITKQIVESSLYGKPAEVVVTDYDGYSSHMAVRIDGAPFAIEALCNASGCTEDPEASFDESTSLAEVGSTWDSTATFSLIVLSVMVGAFLLLSFCACLPSLLWGIPVAHSSSSDDSKRSANLERQLTSQEVDSDSSGARQVLRWNHISRTVRLRPDAAKAYGQKEKMILNNISGSVESGTLMAIMGPSGAGKSSLLNILAAVENDQSRISGQILLNGKLQTKGYRKQVAYVQQDDSLYDTLTVLECIEYSALLRLPKAMKVAERHAQVWKTLEELRLTDIAQNRIGNSGNQSQGVSGGERKRVSIGMELVSHPSVLVLDEPTSGLDSYAANQIIKVLSELSSRNRIVILSIHQPSMKSFMMMDQILLLGGGRLMYNGKPSEVEQYFAGRGFPLPSTETVADHMLDVVSDKANCDVLKGPEARQTDFHRISSKQGNITKEDEAEEGLEVATNEVAVESKPLPFEIMILFARTARVIFRNRELFLMQLTLSVVLALFAGGIFNDVSNNLAGFQNRMGAFYFALSFFGFASFSSMDIFVRERHIFVRETGSKYFRAFSYFLAKTVLDMFILRVIPVSIFAFIFYPMMGLRSTPEAFVIFWATLVLFNVCAGIMSICISIATPTVGQANLIAVVWFLIMLLFGGFLVNVDSMEIWYSWLKFASIFYYSFEILMTNELEGMVLSFDAPGYPAIPIYGEIFLETIGMNIDNQTRDLICLCSLAFGFCLLAYFLLLLRVPASAGRQFSRMHGENKRLCRTLKPLPSDIQVQC